MRRRGAIISALAVGAVTLSGACGADSTVGPSAPTDSPTAHVAADAGPFFGPCGNVDDAEATAAFALGTFSSITRNSVGCVFELVGPGGPSLSFSWYRGSPIGRERAGSDLLGRPAADVEIGGQPGFVGSVDDAAGTSVLCELGVQFGDHFAHWSVSYQWGAVPAVATPRPACDVATELATLTVERARR